MLADTTIIQIDGRTEHSYPSSADKTQQSAFSYAARIKQHTPHLHVVVIVTSEDGETNIQEV